MLTKFHSGNTKIHPKKKLRITNGEKPSQSKSITQETGTPGNGGMGRKMALVLWSGSGTTRTTQGNVSHMRGTGRTARNMAMVFTNLIKDGPMRDIGGRDRDVDMEACSGRMVLPITAIG